MVTFFNPKETLFNVSCGTRLMVGAVGEEGEAAGLGFPYYFIKYFTYLRAY